jgi:hypothetical protein
LVTTWEPPERWRSFAATLWKNGKATRLGDAHANSVFVAGEDVYVAGYEAGFATVWKNGEPLRLSLGSGAANAEFPPPTDTDGEPLRLGGSVANSVFVSGNDVYVAGYKENVLGNPVAMLWKNGEATRLSSGNDQAPDAMALGAEEKPETTETNTQGDVP